MPRMNGSELAAALKANASFREVPIVVLSSSGYEADRRAALDGGCEGYYQKPSDFDQLIVLLRQLRKRYCSNESSAVVARL
jgi:CheY-like chemotaxis protein